MTFKQLCLYLNLLIADTEIPEPTIGLQPKFFSPPYEHPNMSGEDILLMRYVPYRGISLVLSVDYKYSEKNSLDDIARNYTFSDTKISPTKYKRKTDPFEVYNKVVHKPKNLNLPSQKQSLTEFSLYIGKEPTKYVIGELKKRVPADLFIYLF